MQTVDKSVVSRIYGNGRGWAFSPNQFLDLGGRQAVDVTLHRLAKAGTIRRLARGLYDYPKHHPTFGTLSPDPDAVAKALAGKHGVRLQPSGAYAANLLGLSEQVPAKIVFLTDGPSKRIKLDAQEISLKRTAPRNLAMAGRLNGLVIQALRYLGKARVSEQTVRHLQRQLQPADLKSLRKDAVHAPAWIGDVLRRLSAES
ncbi:MAG: DUF6088 family protein [Verrucomicrobiales bacterium]|jgi:hypothetical protein|nr:DUF6088 family protein [Verrucomicrobiales bacterium]